MRRFLSLPVYLFLTASVLIIGSCAPEACFEETNAFVKATMLDNETKANKSPDSLTLGPVRQM